MPRRTQPYCVACAGVHVIGVCPSMLAALQTQFNFSSDVINASEILQANPLTEWFEPVHEGECGAYIVVAQELGLTTLQTVRTLQDLFVGFITFCSFCFDEFLLSCRSAAHWRPTLQLRERCYLLTKKWFLHRRVNCSKWHTC